MMGSMTNTLISRIIGRFSDHPSSAGVRIILIVVVALLVHVVVRIVRGISDWLVIKAHAQKNAFGFVSQQPKFLTITRLLVSTVIFCVYFLAIGMILEEFGVKLTTYLASGAVIGLAISFGSQGLVQDVLTGLTVIFVDAMDVGDMVEIVGTAVVVGRVEEIGLRFTRLVNIYDQNVFIPNRTIANVSRYPQGGVAAFADVQVPVGADPQKIANLVSEIARGMGRQFGAIILAEPQTGPIEPAREGGWTYFRVHFKIWPGQGALIEVTFRQQVLKALREIDPTYAEWQVPVTYRAQAVSRAMGSAAATRPPA